MHVTVSGYYDAGPYLLTKMMVDVPFLVLADTMFAIVAVFMTGLRFTHNRFGVFLGGFILGDFTAQRCQPSHCRSILVSHARTAWVL